MILDSPRHLPEERRLKSSTPLCWLDRAASGRTIELDATAYSAVDVNKEGLFARSELACQLV
jgi:hypothetical protein